MPRKNRIKDMPGEHFEKCPFCGGNFHHNGLPSHKHFCEMRGLVERQDYARKKHILIRSRSMNNLMVPVKAEILSTGDKARIHVRISLPEQGMLEIVQTARSRGFISLPMSEEEEDERGRTEGSPEDTEPPSG